MVLQKKKKNKQKQKKNEKKKKRLNVLQKYALRAGSNSEYRSHSYPLFYINT